MYANCVIEYPIKTLDKAFTYFIPENLRSKIKVGMRVLVPFGTKKSHGLILAISNEYREKYLLKSILSLFHTLPPKINSLSSPHNCICKFFKALLIIFMKCTFYCKGIFQYCHVF